jgi:hypothetical protein
LGSLHAEAIAVWHGWAASSAMMMPLDVLREELDGLNLEMGREIDRIVVAQHHCQRDCVVC